MVRWVANKHSSGLFSSLNHGMTYDIIYLHNIIDKVLIEKVSVGLTLACLGWLKYTHIPVTCHICHVLLLTC